MKKSILVLILALLLLPVHALASSVDLSGMSFDELVALKEQINLALWQTEEWQEVTVPQGVYTVGQDIPAGHWTITPAKGQWGTIKWGDVLDESGRDLAFGGSIYVYEILTCETNGTFSDGDRTQIDFELKDGQFVIVDNCQMVFSPFSGKPDLGFK